MLIALLGHTLPEMDTFTLQLSVGNQESTLATRLQAALISKPITAALGVPNQFSMQVLFLLHLSVQMVLPTWQKGGNAFLFI